MSILLALVHSPMVGPATWETLAPIMRERAYDAVIPDLTSTVSDGPPYWSRQVHVVAESVRGRPTILVGHSGAGPLLAAMGDAIGHVDGYVFVDAGLPEPGTSWFEAVPAELAAQLRGMARDGWLPPWSQWWSQQDLLEFLPHADVRERFAAGCPRLPLAMFEEVHPPAPSWPSRPSGYLRLSDAYQAEADRARALGWPVIELASHHLAVLSDPDLVIDPLLDLVARLQR